eukprot:TRINITY_DN14110_c0_g2_i1.p1 TRINITY_DN14110_c0_g2~~TRINITY_DN14110_c0_g2_i1.p1  ORF type:complete len:721 (+),score=157.96 TRINITY_DN14110_c0_g2_i1:74-2236(+)
MAAPCVPLQPRSLAPPAAVLAARRREAARCQTFPAGAAGGGGALEAEAEAEAELDRDVEGGACLVAAAGGVPERPRPLPLLSVDVDEAAATSEGRPNRAPASRESRQLAASAPAASMASLLAAALKANVPGAGDLSDGRSTPVSSRRPSPRRYDESDPVVSQEPCLTSVGSTAAVAAAAASPPRPASAGAVTPAASVGQLSTRSSATPASQRQRPGSSCGDGSGSNSLSTGAFCGAACKMSEKRRSARKKRTAINRKAFQRVTWREATSVTSYEWNEADELGRGSFGIVFEGHCKFNRRQTVAVKRISRTAVDNIDQLWAEIQILGELDHPNVLRLFEAYTDRHFVYVITEVCQGGDLEERLSKVKGDVAFARRVVREAAGVLSHCHARGICHRDLKPENILLLSDSHDSPIRIADFGLAKRISSRVVEKRLYWSQARSSPKMNSVRSTRGSTVNGGGSVVACASSGSRPDRRKKSRPSSARFTSCAGTPEYMAPEVLRVLDADVNSARRSARGLAGGDVYYDFRCDVWSLGVIAFQLVVGERPYSLLELSQFVAEGEPLPPLEDKLPESLEGAAPLRSFFARALETDFGLRAHACDLLEHAWLRSEPDCVCATPSTIVDLKSRLRSYAVLSDFKRAALTAAVPHLGAYEHEHLRRLFQRVDVENTGTVTTEDLKAFFCQAPETPASLASLGLCSNFPERAMGLTVGLAEIVVAERRRDS